MSDEFNIIEFFTLPNRKNTRKINFWLVRQFLLGRLDIDGLKDLLGDIKKYTVEARRRKRGH